MGLGSAEAWADCSPLWVFMRMSAPPPPKNDKIIAEGRYKKQVPCERIGKQGKTHLQK